MPRHRTCRAIWLSAERPAGLKCKPVQVWTGRKIRELILKHIIKLFAAVLFIIFAVITPLKTAAQTNDDLLPVGAKAPDFVLKRYGGGTVRLSDMMKTRRVVLLNFWMIYCPPCREELPELNKMRTKFRSKGFDILSVNVMDSPGDAAKFWSHAHLKMRMGLNGSQVAAEKYHVTAVPANYIIGQNGKILARYVGYDAAGIRKTLAKFGVK